MVTTAPRVSSELLAYLQASGLVRRGHYAFRSGRHSEALLDRDRLLADPAIASRMGYALAKAFFTDHVETVATPSIWGVGLAQWTGYFLEPRAKVVFSTPSRNGQRAIAEPLHDWITGRRLLLVDNLVISGTTMSAFCDSIERLGGTILGIGTLWDGTGECIRSHEVLGLLNDLYPAYPPDDCPLCSQGEVPVERIPY